MSKEITDDTGNIVKPLSDDEPTDGVAPLIDSLSQSIPDVQEHAIDAHEQKEEALREETLTDVDGTVFDPVQHRTKGDGSPSISKKGKFIRRPKNAPYKGDKSASAQKGFVGGVETSEEREKAAQTAQARATGAVAANLLLTVGMVAGGEEWKPVTNAEYGVDEKMMLEQAFGDYFVATGKSDMPPGMVLTVAIAGYALPRFTMPKTQSRVGKLKSWFVKWRADRRLKKYGMVATKNDPENE